MAYEGTRDRRLLVLGSGLAAIVLVVLAVGVASPGGGGEAGDVQGSNSANLAGLVDLGDADATLVGDAANDTAGWSVASGDVDGDGVADVLVGAPTNDSTAKNSGAVYVFYGPVERGTVSLDDADARLHGVAKNDFAGWSVAAAGDLNDDGYDDVVVGAPGSDVEAGSSNETRTNAGATYVVYGSDDLEGELSLADANVTVNGSEAYDRAGWSVDGAGTVGRNGSAGILVGAPAADIEARNAGAAYLVPNASFSASMDVDADGVVELTGGSAGAEAGYSVSNAGDVNDDGVADVIVGSPGYNASDDANATGAAHVVAGPVTDDASLADANATLVGVAAGDRAGHAVSDAGDPNDDGVPDVLVGAPANDDGGNGSGAAYVVYGSETFEDDRPLARANVTLVGAGPHDRAGWSLSSTGDANCDGVDDVFVGAPANDTGGPNAGAAYLVEGTSSRSGAMDLTNASATFVGEARGDRAGWAVAAGGDHDGDDAADILVGAPYNDTGGHDAGVAYHLRSACGEAATSESTPRATPDRTPGAAPPPTSVDPGGAMDDAEATPSPTTTATAAPTPTAPATASPTPSTTQPPTTPIGTETPAPTATSPDTPAPTITTPDTPAATPTPGTDPPTATPPTPAPETPGTDPPTATPSTDATGGQQPVSVTFSECTRVDVHGVQVGDTVVVRAVSADGTFETLELTVQEAGLEGVGADRFYPVTSEDFAATGAVEGGWLIHSVLAPVDRLNPNVDPTPDGPYTCGG